MLAELWGQGLHPPSTSLIMASPKPDWGTQSSAESEPGAGPRLIMCAKCVTSIALQRPVRWTQV